MQPTPAVDTLIVPLIKKTRKRGVIAKNGW